MTTETAPRVNKTLLIALTCVLMVAALFLLVVNPLLLSADAPSATDATPAAPGLATTVTEATPDPEPVVEPAAPEPFEIYNTRDPFQQLVQIAPAPAAPEPAPAPAEETVPAPADTAPAAAADPAGDAPASTEVAAAQPAAAQVAATSVKLNDVVDGSDNGLVAQVVIDGQSYQGGEGQAFTDDIAVVALSGKCGTFLYRQQRFTLCQGEEVLAS